MQHYPIKYLKLWLDQNPVKKHVKRKDTCTHLGYLDPVLIITKDLSVEGATE